MDSRWMLYKLGRLFPSPTSGVRGSTREFGRVIGLSQQSTSRILRELAREGLIEKHVSGRGHEIRLSKEGVAVLREMKDTLENLLNAPRKVSFEGVVSAGLGEGAYYVKEYEGRIFKRLGFKPYPGTLNVRLGRSPQDLLRYTTVEVLGFEKDGRRYGVIRFAKAKIAYGRKEVECFFVLPERTHHREEAEFISKENLRSLLGISDGSKVRVSFVVK